MATVDLLTSGFGSNSGWSNVDTTVVNTSDDSRMVGTAAGAVLVLVLDDVPGDFVNVNGDIVVTVEAKTTGTVSRQKQLFIELLDASLNVLGSTTTSNITATDANYTLTVSGRTDNASFANGYQVRLTVQEGGGMGDTATVDVDYMVVNVTYNNVAATRRIFITRMG